MTHSTTKPAAPKATDKLKRTPIPLPGQVVLTMQGGGALGAFQAGVYEAMHEAGIEPDWVVGTSIGAINGAIIAGNAPQDRVDRLRAFWSLVAKSKTSAGAWPWHVPGFDKMMNDLGTVTQGIPGFFTPNLRSWSGMDTPLGVENASYYSTAALRRTLAALVDFGQLDNSKVRLTLGAVNVRSGRMRYFDSRDGHLNADHVMASGALPPAFPAVMIDDEPYWDGGIYSNTPIEVVMDDDPRRDSVIFSAQLWRQEDDAPDSVGQVLSRLKDIQYSSRAESHTTRQQQIHQLRHAVHKLGNLLPESLRAKPGVNNLLDQGCGTVMHLLTLYAPALEGEDRTKDIDFMRASIDARWSAGRELARVRIAAAPWNDAVSPDACIVVHDRPPA
ncbi:MAG: patatin-like phospholipase family protein [Rhodanobacter sp.]|nr:MAG: patatin-like phospholipase family protein [Rhodanobacter sp.]